MRIIPRIEVISTRVNDFELAIAFTRWRYGIPKRWNYKITIVIARKVIHFLW